MASSVRCVEYYYAAVKDHPGAAYEMLQKLASDGVNLLAFNAIPTWPWHTQLMIFPAESEPFLRTAQNLGVSLVGPEHAFLVQGDDRLGGLADVHQRLYEAQINVYSAGGVSDGRSAPPAQIRT